MFKIPSPESVLPLTLGEKPMAAYGLSPADARADSGCRGVRQFRSMRKQIYNEVKFIEAQKISQG